MTREQRLKVLEDELKRQLEYRLKVSDTGSTIDYTRIDFKRESMLRRKIRETKDWIKAAQ